MAITIKKRKGESNENLLKRFLKAVSKSGILIEARKRLYKERNLSERKRWESAIYREKKKKEYEKLRKWGKI